ncbi:MAG: tRNA (adenosine(37)-N6)-threonylcarbamoyltransferase complex ATPase subunit type 1 TsaE, partial [Dialister sp.]|nr:tRNA (adenosine(37)-N6)-threonylcarbamoyltransferase complex ATPase subunit type 1 TsaE [Dialister sp.]
MKHEVVLHTKSVDETMALGRFLGASAVNDEFIALSGDLGAGKTHFVQGL